MHSIPQDERVQPVINLEPIPYPRAGDSSSQRYFPSTLALGAVTNITAADGTNGVRGTCQDGTVSWALYFARGATAPIKNPTLNDTYTIFFNIRTSSSFPINIVVGTGPLPARTIAGGEDTIIVSFDEHYF